MMSDTPFWQFPYRSTRMPVLAGNAVCCSQPLAAQAGLRMLLKGGNAVDAALAAAMTLTVVEPVMNGIGGDAFALVWDQGRLSGLNASGRAPAAWTPEYFAGKQQMPLCGWDTVTVPGAVSAWADLSARFGKLSFEELFEPAIGYAEEGFHVSPVIARFWESQVDGLKDQPGFVAAFTREGRAPKAGELWRFPDQAKTLRRIAQSKGRDFYEGDLAKRIVAFAKEGGGVLSAADLAQHVNKWVEPISVRYRGNTLVHELPPNGHGIGALMALGMLNHFDPPTGLDDAVGLFHLPIEALKLAFADLYAHAGEPAAMHYQSAELLDPDYLARRARKIDLHKAGAAAPGVPGSHGTVYLTAADQSGMMVSYIQSNYKGFGSGVVVPGTGIALHNRGRDFTLEPGHPNQVGPRKRPLHTIIPAFITRDGKPLASYGVMGGTMQIQGHVQVAQQLVDLHGNPQACIDAPRFRVQPDGSLVALEAAVNPAIVQTLADMGHALRVAPPDSLDFGSGQMIYRQDDGSYIAASDPRRDGLVAAF